MWEGRLTFRCSKSSHNRIFDVQFCNFHLQDLLNNTIPEAVSSKSIWIKRRSSEVSEKKKVIKLYVNLNFRVNWVKLKKGYSVNSLTRHWSSNQPFLRRLFSKRDPRREIIRESLTALSEIKNSNLVLLKFLSLHKHSDGSCCFFSFNFLENHTVWFEDLFELSKNFDAPIHWRVRVRYFNRRGDPANFWNREVWVRAKLGVTVEGAKS
jgi:hypothetical protein